MHDALERSVSEERNKANQAGTSYRPLALNGYSAQNSLGLRVERPTTMNDAAIVPDNHITPLPTMLPDEARVRYVVPKFVEQGITLLHGKALHIPISLSTEEQGLAPRFPMGPHHGVNRAGSLGFVRHSLKPASHCAARCVGDVMDRL